MNSASLQIFLSPVSSGSKNRFNPHIARGLGYYTGCVYETTWMVWKTTEAFVPVVATPTEPERFTKKPCLDGNFPVFLDFSPSSRRKNYCPWSKTRTQVLIALLKNPSALPPTLLPKPCVKWA